jgi:hypothetical protein
MNRKDKIQLLKDLSAGRKLVSDLQPKRVEMWLIDDDGMYVELFKELRLSKAAFEAHKANGWKGVMLVPDERFNA